MRGTRILSFMLAAVLLLGFSSYTPQKRLIDTLPELAGSWQGDIYQYDVQEWWSVSVKFDKSGKVQGDYPSLCCGGRWILKEHTGNRYVFVEKLDYGKDLCNDSGLVIVELTSDGNAEYSYYWPTDKVLNAKGSIQRVNINVE